MDAEIQAMDGNQTTVQVLDSGDLPNHNFLSVDTRASVVTQSLPSLDAGFRHPCRNDGPSTLVYNGESRSLETSRYIDCWMPNRAVHGVWIPAIHAGMTSIYPIESIPRLAP